MSLAPAACGVCLILSCGGGALDAGLHLPPEPPICRANLPKNTLKNHQNCIPNFAFCETCNVIYKSAVSHVAIYGVNTALGKYVGHFRLSQKMGKEIVILLCLQRINFLECPRTGGFRCSEQKANCRVIKSR